MRVNSLQDVARRETGRGSRPARRPRPRRRTRLPGLWESRDSATRGACSMAWALADFRCPHRDCASGPLATWRELCGAAAGWGARVAWPTAAPQQARRRWSFVTIAGTLDSGAGGLAPLSPPAPSVGRPDKRLGGPHADRQGDCEPLGKSWPEGTSLGGRFTTVSGLPRDGLNSSSGWGQGARNVHSVERGTKMGVDLSCRRVSARILGIH